MINARARAPSLASRWLRRCIVIAALSTFSASIGAATYIVTANSDRSFTPAQLTIYQYDHVKFENAGGMHNVHAQNNSFICGDDCSLHSGPSSSAWQHTITFNALGDIGYYCDSHADYNANDKTCSGMCAVVTVLDRVMVDGFDQTP